MRYWFFWSVFKVLGWLPLPVLYAIADFVAWAGYRVAAESRANVISNVRHAMPVNTGERQVERAAKQVFRNVAYYYADMAHMPRLDPQKFFDERLTAHGIDELLKPAIASGRGVIMLSAHFGNPEVVGQGLIPLGIKVLALTEPLEPRLSRLFDERRSSHGHEFAPVGVGSVKRVLKKLKDGGVVVLMGDRDIKGPREMLPFLGCETWMPTGPFEVAVRTGAIVIPSFSYRRREKFEALMEEPLDIKNTGDLAADARDGALQFLARFERHLRKDPGQWGVLERVWAEDGRGEMEEAEAQKHEAGNA
jgi:KDO2-lipid IV(A) lauroyltransferase